MTPSDLKAAVDATGSKFFNRDAMKFFGDTMRNFGVCEAVVSSYSEENIECWELYRKRPVRGGVQSSAFFCKKTFRRVHPKI